MPRWTWNKVVESTDGLSFAEVEELKNLLIMHFMDKQEWNWEWAMRQLEINRHELGTLKRKRHVGFGAIDAIKEEVPFNGN